MTVATMVEESNNSNSSSLISSMEPLYDLLLQQKFVTSEEAIDYCQKACLEYGFNVKHKTGANRNIYVYCSREGLLPDNNNNQQQTPILRKRPSSLKNNTSECQWRVVLGQDEFNTCWKFRKSLNPNASEHNHDIEDTNDVWPQEIINKISQLARQPTTTDKEIREIIKLQYSDSITCWNDRRFSNYLLQERKRQKQKEITKRVQKLIMASTKLCSVVAANEDWASCVETDLSKMLDNYRQRTRVSNQSLDSMVDLQLDMIHSEIDKAARKGKDDSMLYNKKRKTIMNHNNYVMDNSVQIMSVPSCTLYIRSQPLRSLSEPSSQQNSARRAFNDLIPSSSNQHPQQQHLNTASFGVSSSVFTLTSPISSPSSTSSIQQRIDYGNSYNRNNNDMLQSPPIPDSAGNMIISSTGSHYNSGSGGSGGSGNNYGMYSQQMQQNSFSPYQQSSSNFSSGSGGGNGGNSSDVNFSFEATATTYGQLTTPSPAPILIHRHGGNDNRMSYNNSNVYYNTTSGREDSSPSNSNSSIQQRIMLQQQQEYEQHQRHLIDSSSNNVHLPTIRSSGGNNMLHTTTAGMVQHHHHPHHAHPHHQHTMNPNQPQQNWS